MPTLDRTIVAGGGERVRYDPPAMTLHWLTALLVLTLWTLAQAWGFLQHGTPLRHELQALHVSLGLVLIVVLALRIGWRAGPSRRLPPAATGAAELAARAMHYLLYALLLAEVALGLGFRWAGPDPLGLFGLFTIPAPFALTQQQGRTIAELHQWIGNSIVALAALHALAALFHHLWLRDDTLLRMLPGRGGTDRLNLRELRRWARPRPPTRRLSTSAAAISGNSPIGPRG
jgi:cytochrome b561